MGEVGPVETGLKASLFGPGFDTICKIAIGCMYQFSICNNFIKFNSYENLKSVIIRQGKNEDSDCR